MDRAEVMHRLRGLKATAETTRDREALDLAVEALLEKHQLSGETSTNWGVSEDGKTSWRTEPTRDDQMETQGERMTRIVYELSGETSTISEKESVEDDLINKSLWRMGLDDTNVILCKMANTSTNEDDAESATTTNCISRQDAIEAICSECAYGVAGQCNHSRGDSCDFSDALESLPPVTPTERTGEWIDRGQCQVDEDAYDVAICSNCGAEITLEYPNDNYCPNCGADMKGGTEK